jgi:hypothetical protein
VIVFPADDKKPVTPLPRRGSVTVTFALALLRGWAVPHSSRNFFFDSAFSGRLRPVACTRFRYLCSNGRRLATKGRACLKRVMDRGRVKTSLSDV